VIDSQAMREQANAMRAEADGCMTTRGGYSHSLKDHLYDKADWLDIQADRADRESLLTWGTA
jgi:hypothetical protein